MGTWGTGAFENDNAADWSYDLVESDDDSVVRAALGSAADASEDDYLEAPDGELVVAAAEVVAAAAGRPAADLPEEVADWLRGKEDAVSQLRAVAERAVARVMAPNSELRELWSPEEEADPDDVAEWESRIANLQERLRSP